MRGRLQCRVLGCAVESWDEHGHSLTDELGELVLTQPLPSMPLFLWGDDGGRPRTPRGTDLAGAASQSRVGERYRESYFDMYPGIWRHGDWIRITPRGGAVIYGRSDSTINRQGVRMGTSEIYRATAAIEDVVDALVVDIPTPPRSAWRGGGPGGEEQLWMVLFVVLRDGVLWSPAGSQDQAAHPRGLLATPCAQRDPADRRGAAHPVG